MDQGKQKVRNSKDRTERANHQNDVQLRLLEKDGQKLMDALNSGKMIAVLSQMEIMYVFIFRDAFQCFIHTMDAGEGRRKSWEINERNTKAGNASHGRDGGCGTGYHCVFGHDRAASRRGHRFYVLAGCPGENG